MKRKKWNYLEVHEGDDRYTISPKDLEREQSIDFSIKKCPMVAEYSVKVNDLSEQDVMYEIINKYLRQGEFIPYNIEERKRMFPEAFSELEQYMEYE